jgi:broad specificity phosphatase PhoE
MGWLDEGIEPGWVRAAPGGRRRARSGPVDWLVSSPLARAVQTAAPLAARLGRQPIVDDGFGNCGSGTARAMARTRSPTGGRSTGSDGGRSPTPSGWKGERPWPTYTTRVAGALEELFAELVDGRVAVVFTLDAVVRAAGAWVLGTGPEVYRHVEVANCSLTTVGVVAGVGRLVRTNENAHLEGLGLDP